MKVKDIKIGETYNGVKVLEKFRDKAHTKYWCICPVCGVKFSMKAESVGNACQCKKCNAKSRIIDLVGQRFGRLVAIEYAGRIVNKNGNRTTLWRCKCDCGNETVVRYPLLVAGNTRSCGCLEQENRERIVKIAQVNNRKSASMEFYKGDLDKHPLYQTWASMLMRCNNPNVRSYKHYGSRGIKVCDRWSGPLGFENFVNDMGERPNGTTLDRIDVNGDYCPENCRWATDSEQANNKTDNVYIYVGDRQITAKQLCVTLGLNYWTVIKQIKKGLDVNIIVRFNGVDMRTKGFRRNPTYYNHNRVVSEEVMKLLENINTNSDE